MSPFYTRLHVPAKGLTRGLTLVETMVSIAVMSFIFAAMAFLVFYTGRNSYIVHEQTRSQTQAAAASERIANTLRGAQSFALYKAADASTTITRITYGIPSGPDVDDLSTGIICFVPPSKVGLSDGIVKVFEDISTYKEASAATDKADWEYPNIANFSLKLYSPYWLNARISYLYRGFILSETDSNGDGIPDQSLAGEFVTDVIAKDHHTGENSADYTTSTIASL